MTTATLASVKQNMAAQAAEAAAEKDAARRAELLTTLAELQGKAQQELETVKARKKRLKLMLADIEAHEDDAEMSTDDLADLVSAVHMAVNNIDPMSEFLRFMTGGFHNGGPVTLGR